MKDKTLPYFQVQWKRKDHATWRIDIDSNESLFKTKEEAEKKLKDGTFDNLDTRITEI